MCYYLYMNISYSLLYYRKNKDIINEKRRKLYKTSDHIKLLAKKRKYRFFKDNSKEIYKKYNRNSYDKLKLNHFRYISKLKKINDKRKLKYHTNTEYKLKEINRLTKYNILRIHNKRTTGKITQEIIDKLLKLSSNRCLKCGSKDKLSIDHIIPVIKNGTNCIDNLQILCLPCNKSKGTKIIDYRLYHSIAGP